MTTKYQDVKNQSTKQYFKGNQFSIDAFNKKYTLYQSETYVQALKRVCDEIASVEKTKILRNYWSERWFDEIYNDWWHPAGSIMQGAGHNGNVSLCNCTTTSLGAIDENLEWDNLESIIKNAAYTVSKCAAFRQGLGLDFSRLRPRGTAVLNSCNESTGSVHWMSFIDNISYYVGQKGRIPAQLFSLSCDHPDIEEFINIKSDYTKIQNANISVQCINNFYKAIKNNEDWQLKFEVPEIKKGQKVYIDVHSSTMDCKKDDVGYYYIATHDRKKLIIQKKIKARKLLELIAKNMMTNGEPGIQNIEIARKYSNSDYVYDQSDEYDSRIISTNACCLAESFDHKVMIYPRSEYIQALKDNDQDYHPMNIIQHIDIKQVQSTDLIWITGHGFEKCSGYFHAGQGKIYQVQYFIGKDNIVNIYCTINHKFEHFPSEELVQLNDLKIGDQISINNGQPGYSFKKYGTEIISIKEWGEDNIGCIEVENCHRFVCNSIISGNSEQYLSRESLCVLASLNCGKFSTDPVQYELELEKIGYSINRFLDNVNEYELVNQKYATPHQRLAIEKLRRTGAGFTDMAGWLFKNNLTYGTKKANLSAQKFMERYNYYLYKSSIELGKEKGSFGLFNQKKLERSPFVQRMIKLGLEFKTLRNITCSSIAPTGCIHEDTRIKTNNGLIKIKDFIDKKPLEKEFTFNIPENLYVFNEKHKTAVKSFYNNGIINGYIIVLQDGRKIKISDTHRLRIYTNGEYIWKYAPQLLENDIIVSYKDMSFEQNKRYITINNEFKSSHYNTSKIKLPKVLDEKLSEFLGMYLGDGNLKFNAQGEPSCIRFPIFLEDTDLAEYIQKSFKDLFNINANISKTPHKKMFEIYGHSVNLGQYFINNNFAKRKYKKSVENSSDYKYNIPELIFRSSKSVIASYLRGLFETDGSITKYAITLSSKHKHILQDVQDLLWNIGIQSYIRTITNRKKSGGFNDTMFALRIRYKADKIRFKNIVGFISNRKNKKINEFNFIQDHEKIYIPIEHLKNIRTKFIANSKKNNIKNASKSKIYQRLNVTIQSRKNQLISYINRDLLSDLSQYAELDLPFKLENFVTTKIRSISREKFHTYDIEVSDNSHTYITANGLINHNTLSLMFRNCIFSYGIEPADYMYFWKRTRISGQYEYYFCVPHIVRSLFKENGYEIPIKSDTIKDTWDGSQGKIIAEFIESNKGKIGVKFQNATEISVFDKLDFMSKIMKWVDSSISVTYKLPENSNWKDIYNFILEAYKKEVKSVAAFPDRKMYGIISNIAFKDLANKLIDDGVEIHKQNFSDDELKILNIAKREIIVNTRLAPKRLKDLQADVYSITVKGDRYIVAVGIQNGVPYEVFGGQLSGFDIKKKMTGIITKIGKSKYSLDLGNFVIEDFSHQFSPVEKTTFRLISSMLRHGVPIEGVVDQLNKSSDDMYSLPSAVARVLKKYIQNGQKTGKLCPSCKSDLVYNEGCSSCINDKCGYSQCS